jgi:hypothetical protein
MMQTNAETSAGGAMSPEVTAYILEQARISALGRMSSAMMHDIRNHLTVVSSAVQLIQMKMDFITPTEMNQRLEQVMTQVDRIRQTMDSAGQFSTRADGSKIPLNPDQSLDTVIGTLRRPIDRSGISVNRSRGAVYCKLVIDAGLFEFVLLECMSRLISLSPCPEMLIINSGSAEGFWEVSFHWIGSDARLETNDPTFSIIRLAVEKLNSTLTVADTRDNILVKIPIAS